MRERKIIRFDDETNVVSYRWFDPNNSTIKGVIEIYHGMAENILRYDEFANYLVNNGFMVIGHDHYAHGETANSLSEIGVVKKYDFMDAILRAMKLVRDDYEIYFQNTKKCAFAHSMGSMAMQRYLELYPNDFDYVVLSGTDIGGGKYKLSKILTKFFLKKEEVTYSKFILSLTTDSFNKKFKKDHPKFGWLSKDKTNIQRYEDNVYCGIDFPTNYFYSLSQMMCEIVKRNNLKKMNSSLRIFIYSGSEDPVSNFGKSIRKLNTLYKKNNINVTYKIINNARHEVHNESNMIRNGIYNDIINFYTGKDKL